MKLTNKQKNNIKEAIDILENVASNYPHIEEVQEDWKELVDIIEKLEDYIVDRE